MASFLGSGSQLLDQNYGPVYDQYSFTESEDEIRWSSESIGEEKEEFRYEINPAGKVVMRNKQEKVEAIFKAQKLPPGVPNPTPVSDKECGICLVDLDETAVATECGHKYCSDCMGYYLQLQIGDIKNLDHTLSWVEKKETGLHLRIEPVTGVICPNPTCDKIIAGQPLLSFIPDHETRDRFDRFAINLYMRRLSKFGHAVPCPLKCGGWMQDCVCTSEACRVRTALLEEKEKQRLYKLWLAAEQRGMDLLRRWAQRSARICPKCGMLIEKNGGCDHMFCTNCKTHYSWSASHFLH